MPDKKSLRPPGWFWPMNSRKAHYYGADRRSLCGKWVVMGGHLFEPDGFPSADDCAACRKKLSSTLAHQSNAEA